MQVWCKFYLYIKNISWLLVRKRTLPTEGPMLVGEFSANYVRSEVFTAVTMKNGAFLDVTPCGSCKN
jgi:hypothetical protein